MTNFTDGIVFDEFADMTPRQLRFVEQVGRHRRAKIGWFNWYINRGRLPRGASLKEAHKMRRQVSWRRAH